MNDQLLAVLPWVLVIGPLAGAAIVYLILPRLYAVLGSGRVLTLIVLAIVITLLMEVRP